MKMESARSPAPQDEAAGHLIGGVMSAGDGVRLPVFDPATGRVRRQVALADAATVARAVESAQAAFPAWSATAPLARARILGRIKTRVEQQADRIVELISGEHGKVIEDARGELQRGIENLEFACYAPELLKGEHSRNVGPGIDSWSEWHPLGVVAGITPFNFPAMVPLWMWPLALACGNTFVLKPSERTPSAALALAQIAIEAGLPPGVLNVVNGDRTAVDALLGDPRVQAVSFVGSTPVAQHVYAAATAAGKRVQALGGAKNHAVVLPDADLPNAVRSLMGAAYGSCGERCMAISVVVAVGDEAADAVVAGLKAEAAALKVGPGSDAACQMGPLVTRQHMERVREYVECGIREGATLAVDGRSLVVAGHESGFYLGPCLFDRVTPSMRIYREEIFGPVLSVVRVASLQQAIELVNGHEYGNGSCIFTRDGEAARRFTAQVEAGMVGINVPLPVPVAYHSFGGWKRSLFGDLHAYGPDGVRFYCRRKTVSQRWPEAGTREGARFSFPSNA